MTKAFCILGVLAVLGTSACQPSGGKQEVVTKASAGTAAISVAATDTTAVVSTDSLSVKALTLVKQYDIASLWQNDDPEAQPYPKVVHGFYGPEHRPIAIYFSAVARDSEIPTLFHVRGKNRFQNQVSELVGTIRITALKKLMQDLSTLPEQYSAETASYSASGPFEFQLSRSGTHPETIVGRAFIDFSTFRGSAELAISPTGVDNDLPAKGAGLLFKGFAISPNHQLTSPCSLSTDIDAIAPEYFKDFRIGDRSSGINPKYAKLGWDEFWSNEEWWAEPGAVTARAAADTLAH